PASAGTTSVMRPRAARGCHDSENACNIPPSRATPAAFGRGAPSLRSAKPAVASVMMRRVRKTVRLAVLAVILASAAAPRASASEPATILHLTNGDRLTGRQVRIDDGRLHWRLSEGTEVA